MVYKVIRSAKSNQDLNLIFRHSYTVFGDSLSSAFQRAVKRIETMKAERLRGINDA